MKTRSRHLEEARQKGLVAFGCLAIMGVFLLIAFISLTTVLAFGLMPTLSPALPHWVCLFIGVVVALTVMSVTFALGGDLPDRVVRVLVVAFLLSMLIPVLERGLERSHQRPKKAADPQEVKTVLE